MSNPLTWPSGVLMEPWHKEDPGIEAPGVAIVTTASVLDWPDVTWVNGYFIYEPAQTFSPEVLASAAETVRRFDP